MKSPVILETIAKQVRRPLVSLVICTYNRRERVERALVSVLSPGATSSPAEVVLIDDGSTDGTAEVAHRMARDEPRLRVICQRNAGLSAARNAGWRAAQSECIAFLDDDAVASPGWADLFPQAFARLPDTVAVIGGPIDLEWEAPRPPWLPDEALRWLGHLDFGDDERIANDTALFAGGNMAWRRSWLERSGGFDTALGRLKGNLLSHEESALWAGVQAKGALSAYLPAARIFHFVPRARLDPHWFRRRLWWEGVSMARTRTIHSNRIVKALKAINYFRATTLSGPSLHRWIKPWTWSTDMRWQFNVSYQAGYAWTLARK